MELELRVGWGEDDDGSSGTFFSSRLFLVLTRLSWGGSGKWRGDAGAGRVAAVKFWGGRGAGGSDVHATGFAS